MYVCVKRTKDRARKVLAMKAKFVQRREYNIAEGKPTGAEGLLSVLVFGRCAGKTCRSTVGSAGRTEINEHKDI